MNPLLFREIQSRWRDGRAFWLVFFFAAGLSLLFGLIYNANVETAFGTATPGRWANLGQTLFTFLSWIQTLAWLLVSPTLTSSTIAYERERGWFDSLILSRLLPRQISLGKWSGALLYAALLYVVTLPCAVLIVLLGGVAPGQFWLTIGLHILSACFGSALGLASSAWSYRAHVALRSAHGLIIIWLLGSYGGATWAGHTAMSRGVATWGGSVPPFWDWLGRTNPVLCAYEINSNSPLENWPLVFSMLIGLTLFFLWVATYYARQPLEEAPFVEPRRRKKKATTAALQSHGEIPGVAGLKFSNPVLNHEVHSKFRMRQPPMTVIAVEVILGLLVAGFYLRTLYWGFFEPKYRLNIWAGVVITGLIVTMMSAAVMGGNGFSREREKGTWEAIQLSMLTPHEIIRGKVFSSLLTSILFSLPVIPLLLPCVDWKMSGQVRDMANVGNAVWTFLIWLATIWSFTLVGLWVGRKQNRSSRASGQTLALLGAFEIILPFAILSWLDTPGEPIVDTTNAFAAIFAAGVGDTSNAFDFFKNGPSFVIFSFVVGLVMWRLVHYDVSRELNQNKSDQPETAA